METAILIFAIAEYTSLVHSAGVRERGFSFKQELNVVGKWWPTGNNTRFCGINDSVDGSYIGVTNCRVVGSNYLETNKKKSNLKNHNNVIFRQKIFYAFFIFFRLYFCFNFTVMSSNFSLYSKSMLV